MRDQLKKDLNTKEVKTLLNENGQIFKENGPDKVKNTYI